MTGSPFFDPSALQEGGSVPPRKATILAGEHLFLGMNVYPEGDGQSPHVHASQDKAYIVTAGVGEFTVGEETHRCGPGSVVQARKGVVHGVVNPGPDQLVILVAMAPPPSTSRP